MSDYLNWWANRAGQVAAATTTPVRPQPEYGAALELSTAPLTTDQHTAMVNDIQTTRDEEAEQLSAWEALKRGRVGAAVGSVAGGVKDWVGDRVSDVEHLRDQSRRAIVGDSYADWATQSDEKVFAPLNSAVGATAGAVGEGLETFNEHVFDPAMRGLATPVHAVGIMEQRRPDAFWGDPSTLLEGETWAEAWERSDNATLGQASVDAFLFNPTEQAEIHAQGFDESGRPIHTGYRELREENAAYNLTSGTLDFLKVWYAAPEVLAAKAATSGRAAFKADLDRMGPRQQARVRRILSTPEARMDDIRKRTPLWDVAGRRAVRLREEQFRLRDQIRAGELDAGRMAEFQAFAQSPQGPVAAHLFAEASRARRVDPNTGVVLDEFDDDLFDTLSGALTGHPGAAGRIESMVGSERHVGEIRDAMRALNETRIGAIDDMTRWGEKIFDINTNPRLTERGRLEKLIGPQWDVVDAVRRQTLAEQGLKQYAGYEDWLNRALTEGPSLSMAPREAYSIGQRIRGATSITYRPTGTANTGSQVIQIPRAAWLQRPGIVNLHSAENSFEATSRFLDQAAYYGRRGDLEEVAGKHGGQSWAALRDDLLNQAAASASDTERLNIMNRLENIAVHAVARRHNMTAEEARRVTDHVRGMRESVVRQAEEQATKSYSAAKTQNGERIDTFRHVNADGTEEIIRLPIDVTQLRNTYIGIDLRTMDQVLSAHGSAIRAGLRTATEPTAHALEMFNHYWKPSVLFRLGYPTRNVIDDGLRAGAAAMNFSYLLDTSRAVFGTGLLNVPTRVHNRYARTRNWMTNRAVRRKPSIKPMALRESVGPVDTPDRERLTKLGKRAPLLDKWERTALKRMSQPKAKQPPKTPPILTRLNRALENMGDEPVPIDAVTGNIRGGDKWTTVHEDTTRVLDYMDSRELTRFIDDHAEILSNPGNAVLLQRLDNGRVAASVGRRKLLPEQTRRVPTKPLRRSGEKPVTVRGEEFEGPMGPTGDVYRPLNSSEQFQRHLYRAQEMNLREARRDNLQKTYHAGEEGFETAWAQMANDHLRKSPIIRRMMDNWTDEDLVEWLRASPEGRQLSKRIPHKAHNPVAWVDELRGHLNHYLPSDRLRNIARERDLDPNELANLGPFDPRPVSVDIAGVKQSLGTHKFSQLINAGIEKTFHALATVPTDTLIRNPFFDRNYKYRLNRMMDLVDDDMEITDTMRRTMERQSREWALKQTKRYMFSLADQSEMTHMLRFVSPFIGAWQESIIRWMRIVSERPETFARLYMNGWEGGFDKLYGVDEDTDPLTEEPIIRVGLPKSVRKGLAGVLPNVSEEDLAGFEDVLISKKSINVTLQGSPWWLPSGGPMVQMPAAYLMRNSPELADEDSLRKFAWDWLFPAGRPENLQSAILPSWMQQFERYHAENDDPVYNNMALLVYKNDYQRWRDGGQQGNEPTIEESWEKAKGIQFFYTASRLGSPFAFRLEPASQLWIDKAREYRELYGNEEGLQHFVEDMGEDAYLWWTSLSKTNLKVPPTSPGFQQYKRWQKQIEKYPELADVIVGLDAANAEFNPEVYNVQKLRPVSPTDPRKQREQKSGEEFEAEVEALQGWQEWTAWRTGIDAELAARGLRSINQRGAEDLLAANRLFTDDQKMKLPGWGREFEQFDAGRGYAYVDALRDWTESGAAPIDRPDVMGLTEYVELHDAFAAELDARQLAGGSRNIEAQANYDLALAWDLAVGELVESNPMFADVYHRYLDRHSLRNGSN